MILKRNNNFNNNMTYNGGGRPSVFLHKPRSWDDILKEQSGGQTPSVPSAPTGYSSIYQQQINQNTEMYNKQLAYLTAENQKLLEQIKQQSATATDNAKKYYDTLMKQVDTGLADANRRANVAEERGTVDARNAYAENVATRGANAEQLAEMGLSGSGYGDFLNAQAYGQQRSDIAKVAGGAEKARNDAKANADEMRNKGQLNYQQMLDEIEGNRTDAIYQAESNFDKAKHETEMNYKQNIFGLKQEEKQAQDLTYKNYFGQPIDADTAKLIKADYESGMLTEDQYKQLSEKYSKDNQLDEKTAFFGKDAEGEMATLSPEDAKKRLDEVMKDTMLTQAEKDKWKEHYEEMYVPKTYSNERVAYSESSVPEAVPIMNNANFVIKQWGREFKVQSAGVEDSPELNELAKDIKDGQMFTLRGEIYVKSGDKIIGVEGRTTSKKDYELLKRLAQG